MTEMREARGDIQLENDVFRVTRWTVGPGETIPMHTHEHDYVVVPIAPHPMLVQPQDDAAFTAQMVPGESYTRARGSRHQIFNPSETDTVVFVEVESLRS